MKITTKFKLWVELLELIDGEAKTANTIYNSSWAEDSLRPVDEGDYISVWVGKLGKSYGYEELTTDQIKEFIKEILGPSTKDVVTKLKKAEKLNTALQLATGLKNLLEKFDIKEDLTVKAKDLQKMIHELKGQE